MVRTVELIQVSSDMGFDGGGEPTRPNLFPMYAESTMMEIMEMLGVGVKVGVMIRNIRFADDQLPMMVKCCKRICYEDQAMLIDDTKVGDRDIIS